MTININQLDPCGASDSFDPWDCSAWDVGIDPRKDTLLYLHDFDPWNLGTVIDPDGATSGADTWDSVAS